MCSKSNQSEPSTLKVLLLGRQRYCDIANTLDRFFVAAAMQSYATITVATYYHYYYYYYAPP